MQEQPVRPRSFTAQEFADASASPHEVQLAHLDNDALLDVVLTDTNAGFGVMWNEGSRALTPAVYTTPPEVVAITELPADGGTTEEAEQLVVLGVPIDANSSHRRGCAAGPAAIL